MRLAVSLLLCIPAWCTPALKFSDLIAGPKTGGQSSKGAFVTVWGFGFGSTRGTSTVTIGGGAADNYPVWTDTKITFQLGDNAATGNIVVTVGGQSSNGLSFTIQSGNIYFVAASGGSDSANGSYAAPWATIQKGKNTMAAGDIVYVRSGQYSTTEENWNAGLVIDNNGTSSAYKALIGYPGEQPIINTVNASRPIIGIKGYGGAYWVIAGFKVNGPNAAVDTVSGTAYWRFVGNELTCPYGSGQSACFHTDTTKYIYFLGNYVHDVGTLAGSIDKYYHAVYFTTNSNHIWAGWNTIVPNSTQSTTSGGCRAIQFFSTGGSDQYDLHVFGNLIHDAICDGINFSTVNPDNGTVEAYNNVVYHVGTGPDPYNSSSNYSCVLSGSSSSPTNPVLVYNNTFYDCGARKNSDAGSVSPQSKMQLRNNLIYQINSESYINPNQSGMCSNTSGSNNLWYGSGGVPCTSAMTGSLNANPLLVTPGSDYHIQSTSQAKGAGVAVSGLTADFDGLNRPSPPSIGAYEYASVAQFQRLRFAGASAVRGKVQ